MPGFTPADARVAVGDGRPLDERIRIATLVCLARRGVRRTTLDDVAAEAGCSRATVYRAFPGGKEVLLASVAASEVAGVLGELADRLADTRSVEDALVVAITGASRAVAAHPALQQVMATEPEIVLPHVSFDGLDLVLTRAVDFLAPWLARFTDDRSAREAAEWAARVACAYAHPGAPFDLTQPHDTRRLVTVFLLSGGLRVATDHPEQEPTK
jgi:AcrR family transcriptional regulator